MCSRSPGCARHSAAGVERPGASAARAGPRAPTGPRLGPRRCPAGPRRPTAASSVFATSRSTGRIRPMASSERSGRCVALAVPSRARVASRHVAAELDLLVAVRPQCLRASRRPAAGSSPAGPRCDRPAGSATPAAGHPERDLLDPLVALHVHRDDRLHLRTADRGRRVDPALLDRRAQLGVDLLPGAVLELALEAGDRDVAAGLERDVEEAVHLQPVAHQEAALTRSTTRPVR